MYLSRAWLAALALALCQPAIAEPVEFPAFMKQPEWLGQQYLGTREWTQLDALVERLAASGERADDGRFQLYLLTRGITDRLEKLDPAEQDLAAKFAEYRKQVPNSAFEPLLEAMEMHTSAWRARGWGFASSVTAELPRAGTAGRGSGVGFVVSSEAATSDSVRGGTGSSRTIS